MGVPQNRWLSTLKFGLGLKKMELLPVGKASDGSVYSGNMFGKTHRSSGWWFGCHFFIFPYIKGMSSSQLTNSIIFQRGGPTTNQLNYGNFQNSWFFWWKHTTKMDDLTRGFRNFSEGWPNHQPVMIQSSGLQKTSTKSVELEVIPLGKASHSDGSIYSIWGCPARKMAVQNKIYGVVHGKSHLEMDDLEVPPWLRKLP